MLTPPGAAAIAVLRIAGPGLRAFLTTHCTRVPAAGRAIHCELRNGDQTIDDPVVFLAEDERFADISLHGGPWVVRAASDLLRREGFNLQHPPPLPLSDLAVDGGSQLEREVLSHLPLATTDLALETLLSQQRAWQDLKTQADVPRERMEAVLADHALQHLLHPPRVAIIGAANVGKSTLANQLFAQERSITADLPGTTRDWVGELANLDGLGVMLVDTPGWRETDDAIERLAIDRSGEQIRRADLILLVLDASRPLEPEQSPLLRQFPAGLVVINKSDRAPRWTLDRDAIPTVATTGEGVPELLSRIRRHFHCISIDPHQPRCWTDRQRDILQRALHDPKAVKEI